jgi:hypothetical protein
MYFVHLGVYGTYTVTEVVNLCAFSCTLSLIQTCLRMDGK